MSTIERPETNPGGCGVNGERVQQPMEDAALQGLEPVARGVDGALAPVTFWNGELVVIEVSPAGVGWSALDPVAEFRFGQLQPRGKVPRRAPAIEHL